MRKLLLFLLATAVVILLSMGPAFAQTTGAPPAALTPAFVVTTLMAAVIGLLTAAYNTGSVFGFVTVPKPSLPWLGLGLTFLTGVAGSLGPSPTLTTASVFVAAFAGFMAMLGNGAGAAVHGMLTAHKSSRGVAATTNAKGGGGSGKVIVDAVTQAANDVSKPSGSLRGWHEAYRTNARPVDVRPVLPIWAGRTAAAFVAVGSILIGLATSGAGCAAGQTPQSVVATTIDLTNAICAMAPDSPVGQPYVEVVCAIAQAGEQLVSVIVDAVTNAATSAVVHPTPAPLLAPIVQIRVRIPAANTAAFLAAHHGPTLDAGGQ